MSLYRLEDVHGVFEEGEEVCRVYVDAELVEEVPADLPVIEPVLPELDNEPGELSLRATAERGVPAFALEKCIKKREQLFPRGRVELVEVQFR